MERPSIAEKILLGANVLGAVSIVAAVAFFALTGSGFGTGLLLSVGGAVLGVLLAGLLTRSPKRGRLVAALVLLLLAASHLLLILAQPGWLLASIEHGAGRLKFASGLVGSMAGASLVRLFGFNALGPRGDQVSRRRS